MGNPLLGITLYVAAMAFGVVLSGAGKWLAIDYAITQIVFFECYLHSSHSLLYLAVYEE